MREEFTALADGDGVEPEPQVVDLDTDDPDEGYPDARDISQRPGMNIVRVKFG